MPSPSQFIVIRLKKLWNGVPQNTCYTYKVFFMDTLYILVLTFIKSYKNLILWYCICMTVVQCEENVIFASLWCFSWGSWKLCLLWSVLPALVRVISVNNFYFCSTQCIHTLKQFRKTCFLFKTRFWSCLQNIYIF